MAQVKNRPPEYQITAAHARMLAKSGSRHKYDYGHGVIVSGPSGQGGAARLAARAALRVGAGLVSVFSSLGSQAEHAARLDAVMVKTYADNEDFAGQLSALKPSAICIGPNLGLCDDSRRKLVQTLQIPAPLCLDADAITLIAQDLGTFASVSLAQAVMTPHEGELRRLIPDAFTHTTCRVSLAKSAAKKMGCCVLFKGVETIVAQPDGDCVVVDSSRFEHTPWLATAGSGDVLSGIITGLMARGFTSFDAASLGATLHLQCAETIGPGLIADDLPEALPRVLAQCLATQSVV